MIFRRPRRVLYRLRFKSGDIAVLQVKERLTQEQVEQLRDGLQGVLPEGVKAVILDGATVDWKRP